MDPGVTNLGWCVMDGGSSVQWVTDFGTFSMKDQGDEKLSFNEKMNHEMHATLNFFTYIHRIYHPTHVAWENVPSFGGMSQQGRILSEVSVFKVLAWQNGCFYASMAPVHMKKAFTGDGKASKEEIKSHCVERFSDLPIEKMNEVTGRMNKVPPDQFDAIGIACVAMEEDKWEKFETTWTGGSGSVMPPLRWPEDSRPST